MRALFVHGVGRQGPGFADKAIGWLRDSLDEDFYAQSVHWAKLADRAEDKFLAQVKDKGSKGNTTQELVVGTLADALMYRTPGNDFQRKLFGLLDHHSDVFGDRGYVIFAHSLGGLIVTDWLRARPAVKDVTLVTLGCNIGLFNLGRSFQPVPQLTAPNRWINAYSSRDFLGFPLTVDPNLKHVLDVRVSLGGLFKGWTGLSHLLYWEEKALWSTTIPKLLAGT